MTRRKDFELEEESIIQARCLRRNQKIQSLEGVLASSHTF